MKTTKGIQLTNTFEDTRADRVLLMMGKQLIKFYYIYKYLAASERHAAEKFKPVSNCHGKINCAVVSTIMLPPGGKKSM